METTKSLDSRKSAVTPAKGEKELGYLCSSWEPQTKPKSIGYVL
jgi:hypothetical protein